MTDLDDLAADTADAATTTIAIGTIRQSIEPYVDVAIGDADPPPVLFNEPIVTVDSELARVEYGEAGYAGDYSASVALTSPDPTCTFDLGDVDPTTLTGALGAYARFLPGTSLQVTDGSGRHVLLPVTYHSGDPYPLALHLKTHVGVNDGTDTITFDADSPYGDPDYSYRGRGGETERPVYAFNGVNALATLFAPTGRPGVFTDLTMAFVAVLYGGAWGYYPIFEWLGSEDSYSQLRYSHGRISLVKDHAELAAHESANGSAQPVIVLLTFDADTDIGQLVVLDRGRTSLEFGMADLAYSGITGTLGAARTRVFWPHEGYNRFGDFNLLELTVWDSTLTGADLEQKLALLAAAYGVPL